MLQNVDDLFAEHARDGVVRLPYLTECFRATPAVSRTSVTPVVSLRAVEDGDLPLFFAWQADEESFRMAAVPSRDAEAFAAHWARIREQSRTRRCERSSRTASWSATP